MHKLGNNLIQFSQPIIGLNHRVQPAGTYSGPLQERPNAVDRAHEQKVIILGILLMMITLLASFRCSLLVATSMLRALQDV